MRLISPVRASDTLSAPQPAGCPSSQATMKNPAGGVISATLAELLLAGSKPTSKRSASSLKYCSRQDCAAALSGCLETQLHRAGPQQAFDLGHGTDETFTLRRIEGREEGGRQIVGQGIIGVPLGASLRCQDGPSDAAVSLCRFRVSTSPCPSSARSRRLT